MKKKQFKHQFASMTLYCNQETNGPFLVITSTNIYNQITSIALSKQETKELIDWLQAQLVQEGQPARSE